MSNQSFLTKKRNNVIRQSLSGSVKRVKLQPHSLEIDAVNVRLASYDHRQPPAAGGLQLARFLRVMPVHLKLAVVIIIFERSCPCNKEPPPSALLLDLAPNNYEAA